MAVAPQSLGRYRTMNNDACLAHENGELRETVRALHRTLQTLDADAALARHAIERRDAVEIEELRAVIRTLRASRDAAPASVAPDSAREDLDAHPRLAADPDSREHRTTPPAPRPRRAPRASSSSPLRETTTVPRRTPSAEREIAELRETIRRLRTLLDAVRDSAREQVRVLERAHRQRIAQLEDTIRVLRRRLQRASTPATGTHDG
jgi:hypothetical protein